MKPGLHMIGNAHLDIVWLWRWTEGFQEVKATFKSALDRIDETEEFIFTTAGASYYRFIEENAPALFERIKKQVKAGRWQIVGGWWLQPDCNLPAGESFARHSLYGQRYFLERFNQLAKVGYNVDSFGHNGNLPQLLKKSGLDYYVFMRPGEHEKNLPGSLFNWQGPDGSTVLAYRIPPGYNQGSQWGDALIDKIKGVSQLALNEGRDLMCFYGVGNHGGGPTKANIAKINNLKESNEFDLRFSSPDIYFDSINERKSLPVVQDDLQFHAIGCYSAMSEIKKNNRRAENNLITAEKMAMMASSLFAFPYPAREIKEGWEGIMLNQFHDILGGCSIKEAYNDARQLHGRSLNLAAEVLNKAVQKISWNIDTSGEELPLVVFNPHAWEVKAPIEVNRTATAVFDDQGKQYPHQIINGAAVAPAFRYSTVFTTRIPAFGYKVFRLKEAADKRIKSSKLKPADVREGNPLILENNRLKIEFNQSSGLIESLYDKEHHLSIIDGKGARPIVIDDTSDTWSHDIDHYQGKVSHFENVMIKLIEQGPVRSVLRVTSQYNNSTIRQDFILYQDLNYLECRVKVNWQEKRKLLKLEFPFNLSEPEFYHEIPYAAIKKPLNGRECPIQNWVDVTGINNNQQYGLAIINDSKYSCSVEQNKISLTCLRSPVYAHHYPEKLFAEEEYDYIDQGEQEFKYIIYPHQGHWQETDLVRKGSELNQPPVSMVETFHSGNLPAEGSYLKIDQANVNVSVIKKAEDSSDLIIRAYETTGCNAKVNFDLQLLKRRFTMDFGPYEIKTIKVPFNPAENVKEVNLVELD